jgi:hypothetical protein
MVERLDSVVYRNAVSKIESGKWNEFKYENYIPKRTDIPKWQLSKKFILDLGDDGLKSSLTNIVKELINRIDK